MKPQRTQRDSQSTAKMTENEASNIVIGCALRVHSALGPGLLESAYAACLHYELVNSGLFVEPQKPLPLVYHDVKLECGYRIDLMVEKKLVIEIKSVECLNDIHLAQVLTYLKLANCRLGLLMNFNVLRLKEGIRRVVNNL
jgi:GxxExxY protein